MEPVKLLSHALDYGSHYHLLLDYDAAKKTLNGHIAGPPESNGRVERHLAEIISLEMGGKQYRFTDTEPTPRAALYAAKEKPFWRFSLEVPHVEGEKGFDFTVAFGAVDGHQGQPYSLTEYVFDPIKIKPKLPILSCRPGEEIPPPPETSHIKGHSASQRLTVFETRMLGNQKRYQHLPYWRGNTKPIKIKTDLHTHSSAQISADGLIAIALKHNIGYPTRLLHLIGISTDDKKKCQVDRYFFPPTDTLDQSFTNKEEAVRVKDLTRDEQGKLARAMAIPPDRQVTFAALEKTVYRYRYPISKYPPATEDFWRRVAEEYKKMGVEYAEITAVSTSFLTPENIAFLHDALPKIEKETGVKLRFLVGMPRNLPPQMLHNEIEKLKMMAPSPYIVGIDFMGFEDNKTSTLRPYIEQIAHWARKHDPDFTLRIHAGENRKNMDNVKESLQLAKEFDMRVRIGHAAHGLDAEAIKLAKELGDRATIEFNPDSNLALNNIDRAEDLNILHCIKEKIPFVVCSDGGGIYQTDARQLAQTLAFTAAATGIDQDFSVIETYEAKHMHLENTRFEKRIKDLEKRHPTFLQDITNRYQLFAKTPAENITSSNGRNGNFEHYLQQHHIKMLTPDSIKTIMHGKVPLLILGATGNRYWDMIGPEHKLNIEACINTLLEHIDPRKVYLLIGRPKNVGITKLLSNAVKKYNQDHAEGEHFSLVSATVQADQTPKSFTPDSGINHVVPLKGGLFTVPEQLVGHTAKAQGHMLCIGGGTFVGDAILVARDHEPPISFDLMCGPKDQRDQGPQGASTAKAIMMDDQHLFSDPETLITHLYDAHPGMFKTTARPVLKTSVSKY